MILLMPDGQKVRIPDDWSEDQQREFLFKVHPELKGQYQKQDSQKTLPESKPTRPYLGDVALNAIQSTANALRSLYNIPASGINKLFGTNLSKIPYSHYAPERGRIPGELISMLSPTPAKITTAEHLAAPLINALTRMGEHGAAAKVASVAGKGATRLGQGALQGSLYSPENPETGAISGAIGQTLGGISKLGLGLGNPIANKLISAGLPGILGGAYGFTQSGFPGALEYGAMGAAAPLALSKGAEFLGYKPQGLEPGESLISKLSSEEQQKLKEGSEAARRVGITKTPGEILKKPTLGVQEGSLFKSDEGYAPYMDFLKSRAKQGTESVDKLLNNIFDNTEVSNKEISDAYDKIKNLIIPEDIFKNLTKYETTKKALKEVMTGKGYDSTVYRDLIKNEPENSIVVWDAVKRKLQGLSKAYKAGDITTSSELGDQAQYVKNTIDDLFGSNTNYAEARNLAQKRIIRRNLEKSLKNIGEEGKGFKLYDKVLKNDDKFNEVYNGLKRNPQAQQALKDLKQTFENLVPPYTYKAEKGLEERNMKDRRNSMEKLLDMFDIPVSHKRKATEFILSGKADKEIDNIMRKVKDRKEKIDKIGNLLSNIIRSTAVASTSD